MCFLHGVLETVKGDESVTTYDVQDKIKNLPSKIGELMHNGSHNFQTAIAEVSAALRAWSGELERRTGEVRETFKTLNTTRITNFDSSFSALVNCESRDVATKLEACFTEADRLQKAFSDAFKAYNRLDPKLRKKLNYNVRTVEMHVERFVSAASNTELKVVVDTARVELEILQNTVSTEIGGRIRKLQTTLEDEFKKKIQGPITKVKENLTQVDNDLKQWIQKAAEIVTAVKDRADEIYKEIDGKNDTSVTIHPKIGEIEKAKNLIYNKKEDLGSEVVNLEKWKEDAAKAVDEAENKCCQILGKVQDGRNKNKGKTEVKKSGEALKEKATKLLDALQNAHKSITELQSQAMAAVNKLDKEVREGLGKAKREIIKKIKVYVDTLGKIRTDNSKSKLQVDGQDIEAVLGSGSSLRKLLDEAVKNNLDSESGKINAEAMKDTFAALQETYKGKTGYERNLIVAIKKDIVDKIDEELPYENVYSEVVQPSKAKSHFPNYKESKSQLDTVIPRFLSEGLLGAFTNGGLVTDPSEVRSEKEAVSGYLAEITKELMELTKLVDGNSFLGKDDEKGVKILVGKLKKMLANGDAKTWDVYSNGLGKIFKRLKDIDNEIPSQTNAIGQALEAIKSKLGDLTDVLQKSSPGADVINTLGDLLETGINGQSEATWQVTTKGLQNIQKRLTGIIGTQVKEIGDTVPQTLEQIIAAATKFYGKIESEAYSATNAILSTLSQQVTYATLTVQNKAKDEYYTKIQPMFEAMQKSVATEINIINEGITMDIATGTKGLLRIMMDHANEGNDNNALTKIETFTPLINNKFTTLSSNMRHYLQTILKYVEEEVKTPYSPPLQPAENDISIKVYDVKHCVDKLLSHLNKTDDRMYNFDHDFAKLRDSLRQQLSTFSPSRYNGIHNPALLDALHAGLTGLCGQLDKAYVNRYSGHPDAIDFSNLVKQSSDSSNENELKDELTPDGEKLSKVCLTLLTILQRDMRNLSNECNGKCAGRTIYNTVKKENPLGQLFQSYGYTVPSGQGAQDGELHRSTKKVGRLIIGKLSETITNVQNNGHFMKCKPNGKDKHINVIDVIKCLFKHLKQYYGVCHLHIKESPKPPCNIHQMLCWFTGLPHNPIYDKLKGYITKLFEAPDKTDPSRRTVQPIYAHPTLFTDHDVTSTLYLVTSHCQSVLTAILGHGDSQTTYGCDFPSNALQLQYPSNPAACFDLLCDMIRRLFSSLTFLCKLCSVNAMHHGWAECQYGKDISTTKFPCNDHSTTKPNCQANTEANDQATCQPRSPLMSYLNDCLPGHLPHRLESVGCKSECKTCPFTTPGMPCLTPLGFRGFSGSTRLGKELGNVLSKMFDESHISCLLSLSPKPPATIAEHFGFVLSLLTGINASKPKQSNGIKSLKDEFDTSIKGTSIDLYNESSTLTGALTNAYRNRHSNHGGKDHLTSYADVYSLAMTPACNDSVGNALCAPYLSPLCCDTYYYLGNKHSNTYLSWAIYLPWTFWDLLNNLYNSFCSITCADWGCRGCLRGDKCRSGKHGVVEDEKNADAVCQCTSIVACRGVAPTLYQYGFTFGEASTLNDGSTLKKCKDFCSQLRNVLQSQYFEDLFKECDNFLKEIRWPFMNTLLALWSLSLLYLLHIAVVRLDVLRIRSHLRSPASHRIAAQSLLAAARVKALANVKGKALDDIDARRISLGNLAGQLSGFIGSGKEVKDALLKGLYSNVNQLEKLLNASCGGEGCCKYNDVKNKLNDVNDKLKNQLKEEQNVSENLVNILSKCNLKDLDGPLNELNVSIPQKIQELENDVKCLKNEDKERIKRNETPQNASQIDKLNKDLQSHKASLGSLETLNELCGYAEKIQKNLVDQNPSTSLLNNLCTGLEKFLGYENGNYTGSGIVYSDLDRLCDGVMSFLHGVLDNIQPKLGQHKGTLSSALSKLKDTNLNGITKYRTAIAAVANKVKQYNDAVRQSNESVKSVINTLRDSVNDSFVKSVEYILRENNDAGQKINYKDKDVTEAERQIDLKLEECKRNAAAFNTASDLESKSNINMKNAVNDLNPKLRDRVLVAAKAVKHETDRLTELSTRESEELRETEAKIRSVLQGLNDSVNRSITTQVNSLVKFLCSEVSAIKDKLVSISEMLGNYVEQLKRWISDADAFFQKVMKDVHKIEKNAPGILNQMNVEDKAKELQKKGEELHRRFEYAKNEVGHLVDAAKKKEVNELDTWSAAAGKVVGAAQGKCYLILGKSEIKDSGEPEIKKQADALQKKATDLLTAYSQAHTQFMGLTAKVGAAVAELEAGMKTDLGRIRDSIVQKMKQHVGEMLKDIKGRVEKIKGSGTEGLDGIESGIKGYAAKVGSQFEKEILEKWITTIVEEAGGPVYRNISNYLGDTGNRGMVDRIKVQNALKSNLPGAIKTVFPEAATKQLKDATVENIADRFSAFADQVEKDLGNKSTQVANEVSQHADLSAATSKNYLEITVKHILYSVAVSAKNFALELQRFASESKISEVSKILPVATSLFSSLETAHNTATKKQAANSDPLAEKVEAIETEVNKGMKDDADHDLDVNKNFEEIMTAYDGKKNNPAGPQGLYRKLTDPFKGMSGFSQEQSELKAGTVEKAKKKVQQHLSTIEQELQAIAHYVDKEKKGTSISDNDNGIQDWLNELKTNGLGNNDQEWGDNPKCPKGLLKIKAEIEGALDGIKSKAQQDYQAADQYIGQFASFKRVSEEIQHNLKELLKAFSDAGKEVNKQLTDFKNDKISLRKNAANSLQKLYKNLSMLQSKLQDGPIAQCTRFIDKDAGSMETYCINTLTQNVNSQVQHATETLTTLAKKQYVLSVKGLLTKFAEKVTEELRSHKGFMLRMGGVEKPETPSGQEPPAQKTDTLLGKIQEAVGAYDPSQQAGKAASMKDTFINLVNAFHKYFTPIHKYISDEIKKQLKEKSLPETADDNLTKLVDVHSNFNTLLDHFRKTQTKTGEKTYLFDHDFTDKLAALKTQLQTFTSHKFTNPHHPELLDALKCGLNDFCTQLDKVYVNAYDGHPDKIIWDKLLVNKTLEDGKPSTEKELTPDGTRLSKVLLTVTPIVCDALNDLKMKLDDWKDYKIYNPDASNHSLHRLYFRENGYDVGLRGNADSGELNHRNNFNGSSILTHLTTGQRALFTSSSTPQSPGLDDIPVDEVKEGGLIPELFAHLTEFFQVGHIATSFSKRAPCSVYEQLVWLTGLPHNPVYEKLPKHVRSLFEVPDKNDPSTKHVMPIDASPTKITDALTIEAIDEICGKAYAVLTTVVGTGDAECGYACEFPSNSLGLQYPSNPAQCFETLLDILRRLFPPLKFLFTQCGTPASEHGWLRCQYGKDVKSTKSQCNEHTKQGTKEPTKCLPKSPLQSYLSDSLIGHLPHNLSSIGCQAKCTTCPGGKPGMPCITPLGFRGFSGSTKTGAYLSSVIGELLEIDHLSTLFALSVKTPRTLPEHFEFASALVRGWHNNTAFNKRDVQEAFEKSVKELSINLYETPAELTDALRDAYGSESVSHTICDNPHLLNLTAFNTCNKNGNHCAPYLSSLCGGYYTCLPFKNSSTYLSWAIYLPWTFWDLLNNLYNAFCQITCADWGCRGCLRGDKCKRGKHGVVEDDKQDDDTCQCESIVSCKGVSSTFYQYGFSFGEASTLNGKTPKKCKDFCSQLYKVLQSQYFKDLFKECDNFLKEIRWPFMLLLLALWSLSLLYLLHIAVVRLDVLRIRSHLKSPSSHRIAAQSLLAAARVRALANVKYFSP
ncbi:hypothetical protein, conserved [Babesia ovata]|uniref:C3H1-type domain-containing protein n=1 Tax=Babesia ovata TaxID=189622 RepID=A0A2H6KJM1_9APIC|nr:uncharacterized protein BOVATA_046800 [Babesia ovata]GBE63187.1 hypothetical protein, conserved [Babesia ovata]